MGSTLVYYDTLPEKKAREEAVLDPPPKTPIWLQFVPGIVTEVVCNSNSIGTEGLYSDTNTILAKSFIGDDTFPLKSSSVKRYKPLLRGITDTPVMGDQVLLCTFGEIDYYLGPINTNNNPNKNPTTLFSPDITINKSGKENEREYRDIYGQSKYFPEENTARLQKQSNIFLDDPYNKNQKILKGGKWGLRDMHGDMVFEGRHGNSLRIGSRYNNPYMVISNGRAPGNIYESSLDGSIIGIFQNGSIRNHFFMDGKETANDIKEYNFRLADSEGDKLIDKSLNRWQKTHTIETAFNTGPGSGLKIGESPEDIVKIIYDYNKNQIFQTSDRITINARKDSIFLSAFEHIHIGSGNSMTFSTSKSIFTNAAHNIITNTPMFIVNADVIEIDAEKLLTLGKPGTDIIQPAVLGLNLKLFLELLLAKIKGDLVETVIAAISHHASPTEVKNAMDDFDIDDLLILLEDRSTGNPVLSTKDKLKPDYKSFILSNTVHLQS